MNFISTPIEGVFVVAPRVFEDARGFFYESYRREYFAKQGIDTEFVQDNHSSSAKGALRGLHFQIEPFAQAKLVRVIRGSVFDVVVDLRPGSKTFGRSFTQTLSAENKKMMYIPAGMAHGFLSLEDNTEFLYKVTQPYSPVHERGVLWNDPDLAIAWPRLDAPYVLSEKDKKFPRLNEIKHS